MALVLFIPLALHAGPTADERLDTGSIIKEIKIPEGQLYADVLVNAVIDSPPKAVWAALIDIGGWPKWLPMNRKAWFFSPAAEKLITDEISHDKAKVLAINAENPPTSDVAEQHGHWEHVAYEEYDLPWPIKNEWVVRRYKYDEATDLFRASWKRVDSKRDGDDGYWEVRPWKDGRTHITYYYSVKAKESVPEIVFKTAVSMTVNSMIKALRHESVKRDRALAQAGPD